MTDVSENGYDHLADASGDDHGEMAVGAWDSLIDHNYKDRKDGLGSGRLHRVGSNFKPVDEEAILRQRYKLSNPAKKAQNGSNINNPINPNRYGRAKVNPKNLQHPKPNSHQQKSYWENSKTNSPPQRTPSSHGAASEYPETLQKHGQTRPRTATANDINPLANQNTPNSRPPGSQNNAWSQGNLVSEPFWEKPKQQMATSSTANTTANRTQSNTMTSPVLNRSVKPQQRLVENTSMDVAAYNDIGTNYNPNGFGYGGTRSTSPATPDRHMANMVSNNQEHLHFQHIQSMNYPYNTSQPLLPQYQHSATLHGLANHTNPTYPYSSGGKLPPGINPLPVFSNPIVAKVEVNLGPTIQAQVSIKMYDDSSVLAEQLCLSYSIYDPMVMKQLQMIFNTQQLAGIKKGLMR